MQFCVCACLCVQKFALQKLQLLLQDHPACEEQMMDLGALYVCSSVCVVLSVSLRMDIWLLSLSLSLTFFNIVFCCFSLCIEVATDWTELSVKRCFNLFVSLLPLNHKLLRE